MPQYNQFYFTDIDRDFVSNEKSGDKGSFFYNFESTVYYWGGTFEFFNSPDSEANGEDPYFTFDTTRFWGNIYKRLELYTDDMSSSSDAYKNNEYKLYYGSGIIYKKDTGEYDTLDTVNTFRMKKIDVIEEYHMTFWENILDINSGYDKEKLKIPGLMGENPYKSSSPPPLFYRALFYTVGKSQYQYIKQTYSDHSQSWVKTFTVPTILFSEPKVISVKQFKSNSRCKRDYYSEYYNLEYTKPIADINSCLWEEI